MGQSSYFHIGLHVDFRHLESCIFQHGLNSDNVRMNHAPGKWFYSNVKNIAAGFCHFEHRGHRETGSGMSMILYNNIRMCCFNGFHNFTQHFRTTDTSHILQADFLSTARNQLFRKIDIIFHRMNRRIGNTHSSLCNHASFLCPFDGRYNVARIVQSTENTGNIHALCFFHFIHQLPYVGRNRIHSQSIETSIQHVCLNARLIEEFCESTHRLIGVFTIKQVHLFRSTTISFHTSKTPHINNGGCYLCQLVFAWDIFAR